MWPKREIDGCDWAAILRLEKPGELRADGPRGPVELATVDDGAAEPGSLAGGRLPEERTAVLHHAYHRSSIGWSRGHPGRSGPRRSPLHWCITS
jgi:hypothetical protein